MVICCFIGRQIFLAAFFAGTRGYFAVTIELLTSPLELAEYKNAITEAMVRGTKRNVESEGADSLKKRSARVNDTDELFTRLFYYGTVQMGMNTDDFWLMPIGLFLDLWSCHKQWLGVEKPKRTLTIDDIIFQNY